MSEEKRRSVLMLPVGGIGTGKSDLGRHIARKENALVVCMDDIIEMIHGGPGVYEPSLKEVYHVAEMGAVMSALGAGRTLQKPEGFSAFHSQTWLVSGR